MGEEHRRSVRARVRLVTLVKLLSTGKVHRVLTNNVSSGGLSFVATQLIEPSTALELEITLPDRATPMTFTTEVVWSRTIGAPRKSYEDPTVEIGVKFVTINPKDQAALKQYAVMNALPPDSPAV